LHAKTNLKVTVKINGIICPDKVVEEMGQTVVQHCKCAYEGEDNNAEILSEDSMCKGSYDMTQYGKGSSNDFESVNDVV